MPRRTRTNLPNVRTASSEVRVLCVSDLHLSDKAPASRTDDWWQAMEEVLVWLHDLAGNDTVLCAGDVFDEPYRNRARPSHLLWNLCHTHFPKHFICVPGQHDLPGQTMDNLGETGLWGLAMAGRADIAYEKTTHLNGITVFGLPWGVDWPTEPPPDHPTFGLAHRMVWKGKSPYPGAPVRGKAESVCEEAARMGLQVLVTGDNHIRFEHTAANGVLLLNPGSLFQTTAAQADHVPGAYELILDGKTSEVLRYNFIPAPCAGPDRISRQHIEQREEKEGRLAAMVEGLEAGAVLGLSFDENIKQALEQTRLRRSVRAKILECLEV